jgi:glycine cleavage system H protein
VAIVEGRDYPENLYYDLDNQIWYEALADGTLKVGFTPWAVALMGEVLVFTPKRLGRDFEAGRGFAVLEGGKWAGSARAAFAGVVVGHNEALIRRPERITEDAFGDGWMLVVRPAGEEWRRSLVTGPAVAAAFAAWLATAAPRR